MDWKEFFKPTKGKIIFSLVVTIVLYLFIASLTLGWCKNCGEYKYENWPKIIPYCSCTIGSTFSEFILHVFLIFIIPFVVAYLIYSFIVFLRKKSKNQSQNFK